ncbi:MAG: S8 family serine peptidase [Calditrichaeota bacterium]|nr:S8 family serine peptidase [Calditrichota bacterium]
MLRLKHVVVFVCLCGLFLLVSSADATTFNGREYTQGDSCWFQVCYGDSFKVTGLYIFVEFGSSVTETQINSLNLANDGEIYRDRGENRFTIKLTDPEVDPLDFCDDYLSSQYVKSAKNITEIKFARFPLDELFANQINLNDTDEDGFDNDIDIGRAWDLIVGPGPETENYKPPVIGMMDDGLLYWHPDIFPNVWQNEGEDHDEDGVFVWDPDYEWFNNGPVGRWDLDDEEADGNDDDGNGWIDDLIGINVSPHAPGYDADDRPYSHLLGDENQMRHCSTFNTCGHGTQCASAVVSQTNGPFEDNEPIGTAGIAGGWDDEEAENAQPGCKIIYVQSYPTYPGMHEDLMDPAEDMYEVGLLYLADLAEQGTIDVVSLSYLVPDGICDYWNDIIQRIVDADVLIFCAASNFDEEPVIWPGLQPGVFSVGCSFNDRRWDKVGSQASNYGEGLKIMAPTGFSDLYDEDHDLQLQWTAGVLNAYWGIEYPGYPAGFGATSGATPTVAGTALLLLCQENELSATEITETLCITTDKIDADINGLPDIVYDVDDDYGTWDDQVGYGELNAGNAVEYGRRQEIELEEDWNWISSRMEPYFTEGNDLDEENGIFLTCAEIEDDLILLKDGLGLFWSPPWDFNNIPCWNHLDGYKADMDGAGTLVVLGRPVDPDEPIPVAPNWNLVAYLPDFDLDPWDAFDNLIVEESLLHAKNQAGQFLVPDYVVGGPFSSMADLSPGNAYEVKLLEASDLIYPAEEPEVAPPEAKDKGERKIASSPKHFLVSARTDDFHSLLISSLSLENIEVAAGDEIGLFTDGICIGSSVVTGEFPMGLAIWQDDTLTVERDGYRDGDIFTLNYWSESNNTEYGPDTLEIFGNLDYSHNPDLTITDLNFNSVAVSIPSSFSLHAAFPNPFNASTTLRFDIPEIGALDISIYSEDGRLVRELTSREVHAGQFNWIWNGRNQSDILVSSGVYILRVNYHGQSGVKGKESIKLVAVK